MDFCRNNALRNAVIILAISAVVAGCKSQPDASVPPVDPLPTTHEATQPGKGDTTAANTTAVQPQQPADPVIATVGTTEIRASEVRQPLMHAYGFDILMYVVQRDLAKAECEKAGIRVTEQDIAKEREWTLNQMFATVPDGQDREKLLDQFLAQPKPRDQMRTKADI